MKRSTLSCLIHGLLGLSPLGMAATITVDDGSVAQADDGLCALSEAIVNANSDAQLFTSPGECLPGNGHDVIQLSEKGEFLLEADLPDIDSSITIEGAGSAIQTTGFTGFSFFTALSGANLEVRNVDLSGSSGYGSGFGTFAGSTVSVTNSRISGLRTPVWNRGIMTLTQVSVAENQPYDGSSGIINDGGSMILVDTVIESNGPPSRSGTGGLINLGSKSQMTLVRCQINDNVPSLGDTYAGGITNEGLLTVQDSTVSGNLGGALLNRADGRVFIENSTFSQNGGGITNQGQLEIRNSTIGENRMGYDGSVIDNHGTMALSNTIVSGAGYGSECDSTGVITKNISNWISEGSCGAEFQGDVRLGPLAYHGGPTPTHSLLYDSEAINLGDPSQCPETDQRGVPRNDGACDLGAFEFVDLIARLPFESTVIK